MSKFDVTGNPVPALKGTSSVDGNSTVDVWADPSSHALLTDIAADRAILDSTLILLRRLVKLVESNAVVDSANRQKVTVEGATITSGTISTVSSVSNIVASGGVDTRYHLMDQARNTYANGIRRSLNWS